MNVESGKVDYAKLALAVKTLNELKDDYLEETHDEQMVKELNRLNNLSKQKADSNKVKLVLSKINQILSSQATSNLISFMSVIVAWCAK